MLSIGDYVIGCVGPAGYGREVTQSVTGPTERIDDDPDAAYTIGAGDVVTIVVAIDDPTTTTIAPTTTTTTLAPTTTGLGAGAGTLPATGTSSGTNTWMALLALGLIGAGGSLMMVRHRGA